MATDSLSVAKYFSQCLSQFYNQGFLEARIDSINYDSQPPHAYAYKGQQYSWIKIFTDSLSNQILKSANVNLKRSSSRLISPSNFSSLSLQTLKFLENNGFPFGKISFSTAEISNNGGIANIIINTGPLITLDTLYVFGDAKVSYNFITSYLGFSKDDIYNEKKIAKLDEQLGKLAFVSVIRPTEVEFIPNKARIYTYLSHKRANQFSGLIGFSSSSGKPSGITLTGDINLRLVNSFGLGERNSLRWNAPGEKTQRLDIASSWPYIAGSKVGVSSNFNLFRRDTSYISINPKVIVDFYLNNSDIIGLGINHKVSSTSVSNNASSFGDFKTTLYQLSYSSGINEDLIFPVFDFGLNASLGIGTRSAKNVQNQNNTSKSSVGEISVKALGYYPIFQELIVLHAKFQGQAISNISTKYSNLIFLDNELFRIGGFDNLRGYNQESILSNLYAITSLETQVRVKQIMSIYIFVDKAYVSSKTFDKYSISWPLSTGFGFQLMTKGGLFNLSYALAKGLGEDMRLNNAKIHVGYSTLF
jgi:hypothetical protein